MKTFHLFTLFLLTFSFSLFGDLSQIHAQSKKKFLPLNSLNSALMPGKTKNPKFFKGGKRVNFFVDGSQLSSSLSKELSTACALGVFNQIKRRRHYVNILMPNARIERFGFANGYGFNLRDKNASRLETEVYLFELDGTSECKVYTIDNP